MATTAARGQFGGGPTLKFVHYILFYFCAKIGAFIKKMHNRLAYPHHYFGTLHKYSTCILRTALTKFRVYVCDMCV